MYCCCIQQDQNMAHLLVPLIPFNPVTLLNHLHCETLDRIYILILYIPQTTQTLLQRVLREKTITCRSHIYCLLRPSRLVPKGSGVDSGNFRFSSANHSWLQKKCTFKVSWDQIFNAGILLHTCHAIMLLGTVQYQRYKPLPCDILNGSCPSISIWTIDIIQNNPT